MIVAIHHNITDARKWEEITSQIGPMIEQGRLPEGVKALCYLPALDGRKADCVWEANSVEELKRFLEPLTSPAARNEYFQVNADQAMGLPVGEHAAAH
jgi:DNA polymerase/3'-5' exonuclease PolX